MLKIHGTKIRLTRGDSANIKITLVDSDGNDYVPETGDVIRFAVKKNYSDETPLIEINIPTNTMTLVIRPEDTKPLSFGDYKYDIQLTRTGDIVDTFIDRADLILTEEVD